MTDKHPGVDTKLDILTRALKERIYATFTGLAILTAVTVGGHATPWDAFSTVLVGVFGISAAGFVAEVVAHQVGHKQLPGRAELWVMGRIALTALGSASAPLVALALSGWGLLGIDLALRLAMGLYAVTLVVVSLVAANRSGLKLLQKIVSSAMFVGIAALVVGLLVLAHLH